MVIHQILPHVAGIIADILLAFLLKSKIPADEAEEVAGKVRKKKVGELFADMEPIDIPAEQEKIRMQRKEIEALRQKAEADWQKAESKRLEMEAKQQEMKAAIEQFKNAHD